METGTTAASRPAFAERPLPAERAASSSANLTICSVSYRSGPLLALNRDVTRRLNPGDSFASWIVVENTLAEDGDRVAAGDSRFEVRAGVRPPPPQDGQGSYHHAAALERAIKGIRTRYLLILDPDFFLIQRHWIARILSHMAKRDLALFGAPWHPRWYRKWRYFPCVHCLFLDTERIPLAELDFTPDIAHQPGAYLSPFHAELEWLSLAGGSLRAWRRLIRHPRIAWDEDRRRRLIIGSARDTGIALYDRYRSDPAAKRECLVPVYRPRTDKLVPPPDVRIDTRSPFRELLENLRPDWLSFVPKRRRSYSRKGFAEFGLPDLRRFDWEEFLWQGRPAAFHLRGFLRTSIVPQKQAEEAQSALERILS